jgi:hypothetical protein
LSASLERADSRASLSTTKIFMSSVMSRVKSALKKNWLKNLR